MEAVDPRTPPLEVERRLHELEQGMAQAALACLELANLVQLHTDLINKQRRHQTGWNLAWVLVALVALARLLTACAGAPFETSNSTGSPLAGAQSSAGAQSAGAAAALSGGAGGVAGGNTAGNSAGSAGDLPGVLGGAGGELGGSSSSGTGGDELGGSGGTSAGGSSSSGAGGGPSCLAGWQGSSCDTCTTSTPPPSGETCAELLGCYAEKRGPANCDFVKPSTDAVVKIAHDVWTCRGGCP